LVVCWVFAFFCRGIVHSFAAFFCAAALCFVPQQCMLFAATMVFIPRQCSLCHHVALCAAALCYVLQRHSSCRGKKMCCFLWRQLILFSFGKKNNQPVWLWRSRRCGGCCGWWYLGFSHFFAVALCIPLRHSAALFLCLSAVLCAVALCFVLLRSFLCCGAVFVLRCRVLCRSSVVGAAAFILCSTVLHDVLFFVLRHCDSCHGGFFCNGVAQCAVALHDVPRHCAMRHSAVFCVATMTTPTTTIRIDNDDDDDAIYIDDDTTMTTPTNDDSVVLCAVAQFCAVALCDVRQHCAMCHSIARCATALRNAAALFRVLQHCTACQSFFWWRHCFLLLFWFRSIVPCAMVLFFCAVALWLVLQRCAVVLCIMPHVAHGAASSSMSWQWSLLCSIDTPKKIIKTINLCGIGQSMLVVVSLVVALFFFVFLLQSWLYWHPKNKNNH